MNSILALLLSYLFVFSIIGISQVLLRAGVTSASVTRKIVHIGVAHWWLFAMFFFDSLALALVGPISFIFINYISYRKHLFRAMEHTEPRKNLGTIYFPIALTILVILTWSGPFPKWYGLAAMLALGWGDGMASLIGESFGSRDGARRFIVPGGKKSFLGTAAGFAATGAVAIVVIWLFSGPLAGSAALSPAQTGFGIHRTITSWLTSAAQKSWIGRPADSTVLFALSRLDAVVRIVAERIAQLGPDFTAAILNPATWQLAPSSIVAIAFIAAAVAAAVELITPWGLDNITLPLSVFIVLSLLLPLPNPWIVRLAWALGLNVAAAVVAYTRKTVTATGGVVGAGVGFLIYLSGGFFFWSVLMAFFVSSSYLSRITSEKKERAVQIHAKGSRRDGRQVLANGGFAAATALLHSLTGRPIFMLGFAIILAAANADTWASEIGVLSRREPVNVLTFKKIKRGTSGGVSVLGLLASAGGALFIGLWFAVGYWLIHGWNGLELVALVAAITGGGFLGSLLDSVLGATVQAQYWDALHEAMTEKRQNAHGVSNRLVRGFHLFTNDMVNALSGILSAVFMIALVV